MFNCIYLINMRIIRFLIEFLIYIEKILKEKPKPIKPIINLPIIKIPIKHIDLIIKPNPIKFINFIKQYIKYMKLPDPAPPGPYLYWNNYFTDDKKFNEFTKSKDKKDIFTKSSIVHCKIWDKNNNEIKFKKINPNSIALNLLENYYPKKYITEGYSIVGAFNKISMVVDHNNFKIDLCIKLSDGNIYSNIYYKNF